jgi:dihydroorotase
MLGCLRRTFSTRRGKLVIKNVLNEEMKKVDLIREYNEEKTIDGDGLLMIPNLVDPHVHFRVPGMEHKEDWVTGSRAAFRGGYTTVFDMPNVIPPTTTLERYQSKREMIEKQLRMSNIPLDYKLWFGVEMDKLKELELVKGMVFGLKIFMTASTSDGCIHNENDLAEIYKIAQNNNYIISAHAEDDTIVKPNYTKYEKEHEFKYHSCVHSVDAAIVAIEKLIRLCRKYKVPTYVLHISTKEEIELIKSAKAEGLPIYAETCPHYLFLNQNYYSQLNGKVKMNPPVRTEENQAHLWTALNSGVIDIIASDHAPHTSGEKGVNIRAKCPSGVPGIETTLPLMLTAWKENRIELSKLIQLMHTNPSRIFNLNKKDEEFVLVNIKDYKVVRDEDLATKVKWSPFSGRKLTGFPKFIFTKNELFDIEQI